eukprot:5234721-Alexandrium_andersonii.AAC.1
MRRFRRALVRVVRERFRRLEGAPSRDADAHRQAMVDLFFRAQPSKANHQAARAALLAMCNGDWR